MKQIITKLAELHATCPQGHGEHITWLSQKANYALNQSVQFLSGKISCFNLDIDYLDIVCILLFAFLFLIIRKPRIWDFRPFEDLKSAAFFVWLCGFFVYIIGFNEHGSAESHIALICRSILSSAEMFVSRSDLIEVRCDLHNEPAYMAIFSLVHFSAVVISTVFILRLFGFRVVSWIKLVRLYLCNNILHFGHHNYAIMFGVNAHTISLAKSMSDNHRYHIIFINLPDNRSSHAYTRFTISHFFHSDCEGVDKYIEDIEDMGALLFNASRTFDNAAVSYRKSDAFKVFRFLGFSWTVRFFLQNLLRDVATTKDAGKVDFFFLSESEQENLSAVSALQKLQKKPLSEECSLNCYCHARGNRNNLAMTNDGTLAFKVHIVDTSNLAVLELKKHSHYHPVNFVEKGEIPGTVSSAFTGMVIGFGESGRDAFRFLYEFSSFVKDDEGNPSEKKLYIVDKNVDELKAGFLNEAPALKNKPEIDWWNTKSIYSEDFWKKMDNVIQTLNYVVITVGNDEEAQSIATSIFEYAYRYRKNLNKFKIFVRLRDSIQEGFLRNNPGYLSTIIPFGSKKNAFSYQVINNDVLEKNAKRFFYRYEMLGKNKQYSFGNLSEEDKCAAKAWKNRRQSYLDQSDLIKRKDDEIKIWYQEEQDRSNAWHIYTKVALIKDDITPETLLLDSNKRLLKNLSDCEHLRWNAKMELLGFEPATEKDIPEEEKNCTDSEGRPKPWRNYRIRKHECITDCQTLHRDQKFESTIPFDRSTVSLSVTIVEEEKRRAHGLDYEDK